MRTEEDRRRYSAQLHKEQKIENTETDGQTKNYENLSGRIIETLVFHDHAELVNIVGGDGIRTNIVVAIKNSRPECSRHAKR